MPSKTNLGLQVLNLDIAFPVVNIPQRAAHQSRLRLPVVRQLDQLRLTGYQASLSDKRVLILSTRMSAKHSPYTVVHVYINVDIVAWRLADAANAKTFSPLEDD